MMSVRHSGCVLLLWFPAVLLAQSAEQTCSPPLLDNGFVLPQETEYAHNETITYSCDIGQKPAVEGWWARITCLNGKWSPEPKCIDESDCLPPDNVPNTKYSQSQTGWFKNSSKIQIRCNDGYKTQNNSLTAQCVNGTWASLPVCERSKYSCSEPPQLPHAVIINQKYQEVFAEGSVVEYQCEDGYTTEQGDNKKPVYCLDGTWTEGPTCRSPSGSGSSWGNVQTIPVSNCGKLPTIPNAEVVHSELMFLKYRCNDFYSLMGPETVKCYSNGMWSEKPTCTDAYCVLNTKGHDVLKDVGKKYIKNGATVRFECKKQHFYWVRTHYAEVQCTDGQPQVGRCCSETDDFFDSC